MRHKEYHGKTALVYYRGGAAGEEVVDDHSPAVQSEPERILLGSGEVPLGVSEVLYDMEIGGGTQRRHPLREGLRAPRP